MVAWQHPCTQVATVTTTNVITNTITGNKSRQEQAPAACDATRARWRYGMHETGTSGTSSSTAVVVELYDSIDSATIDRPNSKKKNHYLVR